MKIYISADIEGVTGVTHWRETDLEKGESTAFREQMTAETAAACQGAMQAGAAEIWVKDAHGSGRNINPAKLPQAVRLIRGWSGHPFMMVQELDSSFQAAALIGYHSRAGVNSSPLAHTMSGKVAHMRINDRFASESLLHTYAAAYVGVPVVLVTGDAGLCAEAAGLNPHIRTVAVQEGVGDSTISIHPELAVSRIREEMEQALQADVSRCLPLLPDRFEAEIGYKSHLDAYRNGFFPGSVQTDPVTVQFETDDYFELLRFVLFAA